MKAETVPALFHQYPRILDPVFTTVSQDSARPAIEAKYKYLLN